MCGHVYVYVCVCVCSCVCACVLRVFDLLSVDTTIIGSVMISLPSVNISGRFALLYLHAARSA